MMTEKLTPTAAQVVDVTAAQCSQDVTMSGDVTNTATNVAPMDDTDAKKITDVEQSGVGGEKGIMNYSGTNVSTPETLTQDVLKNLPPELLAQKRFFPVRVTDDGRKVPCVKAWNLPENQMTAQDAIKATGLVGMDISGHGCGADYFFVDFDFVFDDNGEIIFPAAAQWFEDLRRAETFCERSFSKRGAHFLFAPSTSDPLPTLSGGNAGHVIFFDESQKGSRHAPKIEVFYRTARYILLTGDLFDDEPCTEISRDNLADDYCERLVFNIADNTVNNAPASDDKQLIEGTSTISLGEAEKILSFIPCADTSYFDWFKAGAILHYHFGDEGFELWREWSEKDAARYTLAKCRKQWDYISARPTPQRPATIGTLIKQAQTRGYKLPRRTAPDVYTDPEAEVKQAEAQKSLDKKIAEIKELKSQPQSAERDEKIRALIRDCCEWKTDRKKRRTVIKPTQKNFDLILSLDPVLDKLFGYDEFRQAIVFLRCAPWRQTQFGDEWRDSDDAELRTYLRRNYGDLEHRNIFLDTMNSFAMANSFHELKDFFRNLPKWDNVPRAETFFVDWLNVDDTPRNREVTMKFFLNSIARVFYPGCRVQWCLVLHGNQNIGKSYCLERLGGKWYVALIDSVDDTHAVDALQGAWVVELKEFSAARKAELNSLKSFIERAADTHRFAYDRRARTVPRQNVFGVTVNDDGFLTDLTGNRRFQILHSKLPKFGYVEKVRGERLTDDSLVEQIWAEVYQKFQEMFADVFDEKLLELSRDTQIFGEQIAEGYLRDNSLKAEIVAFLDQKILPTVIWNLMSKKERRQFFQNGGSIAIEETDLITRFKTSHKRIPDELQAEFDEACTSEFVKRLDARDPRTGVFTTHFVFYGTEYRQHVSAAEILNEFFEPTDKRKSPQKVNELVATIAGWHLGERIRTDKIYGDQKNVFWRDATNTPPDDDQPQPQPETQEPNQSINTDLAPTDTKSATPPDTSFDDLCSRGEPLAADEVPPDDDDLPF